MALLSQGDALLRPRPAGAGRGEPVPTNADGAGDGVRRHSPRGATHRSNVAGSTQPGVHCVRLQRQRPPMPLPWWRCFHALTTTAATETASSREGGFRCYSSCWQNTGRRCDPAFLLHTFGTQRRMQAAAVRWSSPHRAGWLLHPAAVATSTTQVHATGGRNARGNTPLQRSRQERQARR